MKPSSSKVKTCLLYLLLFSCSGLLLGCSTPTTAQSGFLVVRYNGRENGVDTPIDQPTILMRLGSI
ncbi:hypothetical protein [Gloeocapsopsis dulcis]|uniref:hypothetical protein n=1 Tax=Gloeocapsopsis dulcis TaxID=2859516 RepID=UPI00101AE693|nr:hypothetical protein [Gloeocapsopsis dulcis]WNN89951.1 hypothetical protein P0S91_02295 [Gloeocapsopsis dulcis]